MKNKLKQHEDNFIHISYEGLRRFFLLILSVLITIGNTILLIEGWKYLKLGNLESTATYTTNQLLIIYPILAEGILIALTTMSLVALVKGGFDKLKSWKDEGLILGIISGIISGLILGIIFGLTFGLSSALISGLRVGLISGLILGIILGIISGLITGVIVGLLFEFE